MMPIEDMADVFERLAKEYARNHPEPYVVDSDRDYEEMMEDQQEHVRRQ
jgi:hypothetical protein